LNEERRPRYELRTATALNGPLCAGIKVVNGVNAVNSFDPVSDELSNDSLS